MTKKDRQTSLFLEDLDVFVRAVEDWLDAYGSGDDRAEYERVSAALADLENRSE